MLGIDKCWCGSPTGSIKCEQFSFLIVVWGDDMLISFKFSCEWFRGWTVFNPILLTMQAIEMASTNCIHFLHTVPVKPPTTSFNQLRYGCYTVAMHHSPNSCYFMRNSFMAWALLRNI